MRHEILLFHRNRSILMKPSMYFALAFVVLCAVLDTGNVYALKTKYVDSYTCTNNADCKKKCEDRGGVWRRDKTGTTHGTCTVPSSIKLSDKIGILQKQLDQMKLQRSLIDDKKVSDWPNARDAGNDLKVMELKLSECHGLGGDIFYDANCESEVICSKEVVDPDSSESENYFQCINEFHGN